MITTSELEREVHTVNAYLTDIGHSYRVWMLRQAGRYTLYAVDTDMSVKSHIRSGTKTEIYAFLEGFTEIIKHTV